MEKISNQSFNSAIHIEGPQNFPPGRYRVTCITRPLTLYNKTIHTYPGLFTVARLNASDETEGYVVMSTEGSLPPEFSIKDDGSVEKHGFWPPEDEHPMGVSFRE